ncbi:MAG: peptidoglycan DD-metalloendopeptidase family protein [Actinomycetota bacterium]|nr:peptidoglycan DD-metalloendopeptidase family protein [Actinomycetota bacterium]
MTRRHTSQRLPRPRAGVNLVLALVLLTPFLAIQATAGPRERLRTIEERRQEVDRRLEILGARSTGLSQRLNRLDEERGFQERVIAALDADLAGLNDRIDALDAELRAAQARITILSSELDDISDELALRAYRFTDRAVAAYKAGPVGYVEGFLTSESVTDLVDRYAYYESALNSDTEMLREIESLKRSTEIRRKLIAGKKEAIAAGKTRLESDRAALELIRSQRADAKVRLESAMAEKRSLLDRVEGSRSRLGSLEDQLVEDSDAIEALLAARAARRAEQAKSLFAATPTATPVVAGARFMWPAAGAVVSPFGYRVHPIFGDLRLHAGVDIGGAYGAPVVAGDAGAVVSAGVMGGYGNAIVVDHGGGLATTYNHLSLIGVASGQQVARGEVLGSVGSTGYSTGPHLHFEVRVNGVPVDPMPYLR